jgi:hypothetical protein
MEKVARVLYQTEDEGERARQRRDRKSVLEAECCGPKEMASAIK